MTFVEILAANGGQAGLARLIGCNKSYINRAAKRGRVGAALALRIYEKTGHKIGPLDGASPKQIEAIKHFIGREIA